MTVGLPRLALRKIREDGVAAAVEAGVSDPRRMLFVSDTFRAAARVYCRMRNPIRRRGVALDTGSDLVREEAHTILLGVYEDEILDFVDRHVPTATDVVELGGGIGFVASYVDRHVDDERTQVVVEPNPAVIADLKRTRELNGADFGLVEGAYEPNGEAVELSSDGRFLQASTVRRRGRSRTVSGVSLRQVIAAFDLEEFVLIADMEGAEVHLVRAELDVILESCPYVIVEYHAFEDIEREVRDARAVLEASDLEAVETRGGRQEKVLYRNPRFHPDPDGGNATGETRGGR